MIDDPQHPVEADEPGGMSDDHAAALGTLAAEMPEPAHPAVPQPPLTGDIELDAAMSDLAHAQRQSFTERIDSGERVHRLLQGRLGDLGRA